MGNRAVVLFSGRSEWMPQVQLQWGGSNVPEWLCALQRTTENRGCQAAMAAHFVAKAVGEVSNHHGLSVYVAEPVPSALEGDVVALAELSHGDAGVIVVHVDQSPWRVTTAGGHLESLPINEQLAAEWRDGPVEIPSGGGFTARLSKPVPAF